MAEMALSPELETCIRECTNCHRVCLHMATGHCLQKGGAHAASEHIRTMLVCAEICRTAAYVMITGATPHRQICAACSEICKLCAQSCRGLDDMEMCIEACDRCSTSCDAVTAI